MNQRQNTRSRARRARRQEGAVLLIVLLMLLMATGSALYAMQATFYEQGAATSYGEASWTRSLAEGAAMSGLAVVEETGETGIPRAAGQELDIRWTDQGGVRSVFSTKYGVPTPLAGATASTDGSRSFDHAIDNTAFATMPDGMQSFCMPTRNGQLPYGAPFGAANIRASSCRVIYETWGGLGAGGTSTAVGASSSARPAVRTVITGIGETAVPGDPFDTGGQRQLHETVGMARAYFDRQ